MIYAAVAVLAFLVWVRWFMRQPGGVSVGRRR